VSTIAEIQEAIEKLPQQEKEALSTWLLSHEEVPMSAHEEADLLASLEKAEQQLDSGRGVPLDKAREMVRKWASK
jgi:predicted AlkP superfamily phosphohydrolase/phosphomutase